MKHEALWEELEDTKARLMMDPRKWIGECEYLLLQCRCRIRLTTCCVCVKRFELSASVGLNSLHGFLL